MAVIQVARLPCPREFQTWNAPNRLAYVPGHSPNRCEAMLVRGRGTCTPAAVGIRGDPAFQSWLVRTTHAGGWSSDSETLPFEPTRGTARLNMVRCRFPLFGYSGWRRCGPRIVARWFRPILESRRRDLVRSANDCAQDEGGCIPASPKKGMQGTESDRSTRRARHNIQPYISKYPEIHRETPMGDLAVCNSSTEQAGRQLSFYSVRINRTRFLSLDNHIQHVQEGPGGSWRATRAP